MLGRLLKKKTILYVTRFLPISSKYFGAAKGCYESSGDYFNLFKAKNIIYKTFPSNEVISRTPPTPLSEKEIHWKFDGRYTKTISDSFSIEFGDGRVVGDCGAVITHDDKLLLDISSYFSGFGRKYDAKQKSERHYALNSIKFPRCKKLHQKTAVLSVAGGSGYYHWLLDALPRLKVQPQRLAKYYEQEYGI